MGQGEAGGAPDRERERGSCWQQVRCCPRWGSCLESNESRIPWQPLSARASAAETSAAREVTWAQRSAEGQGRASAAEGFAVALPASGGWGKGGGPVGAVEEEQ